MSARDLAKLVCSRKLSPVELAETTLRRIEQLNGTLNAYLAVDAERVLADARIAERRAASLADPPMLLGVPVSVKDLVHVKGMPCTGGSLAYAGFVPTEDAIVVERLRQAGAIIVGKTNTPEFGLSATTENRLRGDGRNPWDPTRTSGGSSGGAAASVAAGMGPLGLGSDGGGSVRIPASFCGVFGIKPSYGLIPTLGGHSSMPLFSHFGPLARTVEDAAIFMQATAGYDPRDPRSRRVGSIDLMSVFKKPLRPLRVAWTPDLGYASVEAEIVEALVKTAQTLQGLGCEVEPTTLSLDAPFETAFGPIVQADAFTAQGHLLDDDKVELLSDTAKRTMEAGREITGQTYSLAMRAAELVRAELLGFFDDYDLLLTPSTAVSAFVCGDRPKKINGVEVGRLWGAFPFSVPFNLSGQPAASVPCGLSRDGLPIGVQIVGQIGEDAMVLGVANALEEANPWAQQLPSMDFASSAGDTGDPNC